MVDLIEGVGEFTAAFAVAPKGGGLGVARNRRLYWILGREIAAARAEHQRKGKPARRFRDFRYRTRKLRHIRAL